VKLGDTFTVIGWFGNLVSFLKRCMSLFVFYFLRLRLFLLSDFTYWWNKNFDLNWGIIFFGYMLLPSHFKDCFLGPPPSEKGLFFFQPGVEGRTRIMSRSSRKGFYSSARLVNRFNFSFSRKLFLDIYRKFTEHKVRLKLHNSAVALLNGFSKTPLRRVRSETKFQDYHINDPRLKETRDKKFSLLFVASGR